MATIDLAHVEPGALPRRVRLYALRRELAALSPARALALGAVLGFAAACLGFAALEVFAR